MKKQMTLEELRKEMDEIEEGLKKIKLQVQKCGERVKKDQQDLKALSLQEEKLREKYSRIR